MVTKNIILEDILIHYKPIATRVGTPQDKLYKALDLLNRMKGSDTSMNKKTSTLNMLSISCCNDSIFLMTFRSQT